MGRQFDPQCASAFLEIQADILRVMCELMPNVEVAAPPKSNTPPAIAPIDRAIFNNDSTYDKTEIN